MNHREPPHLSAGMRRALRCLSLLLVPALTLDEGHAGPRMRNAMQPSAEPTPYLPVLGSVSIRVEDAPPPPDLVTRPAAAAPPIPATSPAESTVAVANADAARSTVTPADESGNTTKSDGKSDSTQMPDLPATKAPPPILPDTSRPVVHPEDFLPYFQIPGTTQSVPSAPAPASIPPSSATYTQTPR